MKKRGGVLPPLKKRGKMENKPKINKDETRKKENANIYKNPTKEEQIVIPVSAEKSKIVRESYYKNGITKRKLVGIVKNGKVILDKGIDFTKIKKGK